MWPEVRAPDMGKPATPARKPERPARGFAAPARRDRLEKVVASGFGQRRKMLRTALKTLGVNAEELLEAAGIDGGARAEELDIDQFCALARAFHSISGGRDHTLAGTA